MCHFLFYSENLFVKICTPCWGPHILGDTSSVNSVHTFMYVLNILVWDTLRYPAVNRHRTYVYSGDWRFRHHLPFMVATCSWLDL